MIDQRMVVHQLLTGSQVQSVQMTLRMLFLQFGLQIVSYEIRSRQRKRIIIVEALPFLPYRGMLDQANTRSGGLDDGMVQFGIRVHNDLRETIDPYFRILIRGNHRLDHRQLCIPVHYPYMTRLDQHTAHSRKDMNDMQRFVRHGACIYPYEKTIGE